MRKGIPRLELLLDLNLLKSCLKCSADPLDALRSHPKAVYAIGQFHVIGQFHAIGELCSLLSLLFYFLNF